MKEELYPIKVELTFFVQNNLLQDEYKEVRKHINWYFDNVFQSSDIPSAIPIEYNFEYDVKEPSNG